MSREVPIPSPLLKVKDLTVSLGHPPVEAVRGIDFEIHPGEIIGLAGESGSGKSVTALSLTRLLPPDVSPKLGGTISLMNVGGNILEQGSRTLRAIRGSRIGYIFQEPSSSFNPLFTIRAHLLEIFKLLGIPSEKREEAIKTAMEEVGVAPTEGNLDAYPGAFSGGMLQRMAIACALASNPDLLVADEPTTALDTSTQKLVVELLLRLNREHGMAILFISHDLGLLKQVVGRLFIMRNGSIVESGSASELLTNPQHPYTRGLIDAVPKLRLPTP